MSTSEKHHFQAEIQQVLDLVIHSLYTDRDIFIRELISNAADACERFRFLQTSGRPDLFQTERPPVISVQADERAHTLTITDTGVGMSRAELIENLGTIAHSGTQAFLKRLAESPKPDTSLIGQFGVGFYAAFMAARKVTVLSQSCEPGEPGARWTSEGAGGYEIEPAADLPRGTQIVLDLKEDAYEYAKETTVERVIKRYSNFVQFPIELNGKRVNTLQAIWARQKSEIQPEEYHEFYRFIAHDPAAPLLRLHFNADAPLSIQALLFVPARNLEALGLARLEPEVHLYCRKVLIDPRAQGLLPPWLRFLRGVVDSEDLPLNISRERMQDSTLVEKLNRVLTGRFLKFLEEQAQKEPETYTTFYTQFQRFLKEGMLSEDSHQELLAQLLRFETSALPKGQLTSLAEYRQRMPESQKEIYYLLAPNRDSAETSPYYEVFRAHQCEVLFVYDPMDEFVLDRLPEFSGRILTAAEKAQLRLPDSEAAANALPPEAARDLARWLKETLGDRVAEVRVSDRLRESPALLLERDKHLTSSMRQILRTLGRGTELSAAVPQDLEINPRHPILVNLDRMRTVNAPLAAQASEQIFDNARMLAGLLDDPRPMLQRLNDLLTQVLSAPTPPTP